MCLNRLYGSRRRIIPWIIIYESQGLILAMSWPFCFVFVVFLPATAVNTRPNKSDHTEPDVVAASATEPIQKAQSHRAKSKLDGPVDSPESRTKACCTALDTKTCLRPDKVQPVPSLSHPTLDFILRLTIGMWPPIPFYSLANQK